MPLTPKVGMIRLDEIRFHTHNVRHDLGDLRSLTESIRRYGLMQPVVVEDWGDRFRLRAGHRRVAAANLAGLKRIPALIHAEALEDDQWIIHSVQENEQRAQMRSSERRRAAIALRDMGCTHQGIADAFGCSTSLVAKMLGGTDEAQERRTQRGRDRNYRRLTAVAARRFIDDWRSREVTAEQICAELEAHFADAHDDGSN